ncbi:heparinase II/III family protein [Erysipelothrix aquatica]|uniref:heparinase II/III family protein n=1 Tax=Erysipelothrix aquatica TaxID=2683714 RepID=UPI001356F742|nr:heparinase II/III family protein [Erysipelothrix aquatica]
MHDSFVGNINLTRHKLKQTLMLLDSTERRALIARAELILTDTFVFDNEWDMERSHEPINLPKMDREWNYVHNSDLEWSYMFHRHTFLNDLWAAYALTDDFKYIAYLMDFIDLWILENPHTKVNHPFSWRTIDTAIRMNNWIRIIDALRVMEVLDTQWANRLCVSLDEQAKHVSDNLSIIRAQSNWVAIETSSVIVYEIFRYRDASKRSTYKNAVSLLQLCMKLQINRDGLQWEQSFMYHHEVLMVLLQALWIQKQNGLKSHSLFLESAELMTRASENLRRPDSTQSNFGDSDVEVMDGILAFAQTVLGREVEGAKGNLFSVMLSGINETAGDVNSALISTHMYESGISIIKHAASGNFLMFTHGPLGGGHGHDDLLHLELMYRFKPVLIDSGRFTYFETNRSRLKFKSSRAHNTVLLDDQDYNEHKDAWDTLKNVAAENREFINGSRLTYLKAGHFGYSTVANAVYVQREVIALEDMRILVIDTSHGQQNQALTHHFIFNSKEVTISEQTAIHNETGYQVQSFGSTQPWIQETTEVSETYNKKRETIRIIKKHAEQKVVTYLSPVQYRDITSIPVYDERGALIDPTIVSCYRFEIDTVYEHVLIQHQEPQDGRKVYVVSGHYFYGTLIHFVTDGETLIYEEKIR